MTAVRARTLFLRWRRWLRFRVRGLIVLVLVVGGSLYWPVRTANIQRDIVHTIRRADGSVRYDWEWCDGETIPGGQPRAPRQIVDFIGVDYFGGVTVVELFPRSRYRRDTTDEDREVFGAALKSVRRLPRMQKLELVASTVRDANLADLNGLTNLTHLDLNWTEVSDAGLAQLNGLTNLRGLLLHRTLITDAGLAHLEKLPNVTRLHVGYTRITDAGLARLEGLKNLSELDLSGTEISDPGLVHLEGLIGLNVLKLSATKVTDAGLVHLRGLTKLARLDLSYTKVTDAGMEELERAIPSLTIVR